MSNEKHDELARVKHGYPAESETVADRIETHAVSLRKALAARFGRASLRSVIETTEVMTELVTVTEVFERAVDRLKDIDNIKSLDRKKTQLMVREEDYKLREQDYRFGQLENDIKDLENEREERDAKHRTSLLQQEFIQTKYITDTEQLRQRGRKERDQPRSPVDQLRAKVAKGTERDRARIQVLSEERQWCMEEVRQGRMTEEEMQYYMALVEETANQWTAGKL